VETNSITYQREAIYQLLPDILPLLEMHHAEVQQLAYGTTLEPDWDQYRQMEQAQLLHIFTARNGDNLVGYDTFIVGPHRHAIGTRVAVSDMTYVLPEHRGFTAVALMKQSDKALKDSGVGLIVRNAQCNTKQNLLLEKMGYQSSEIMMIRKV